MTTLTTRQQRMAEQAFGVVSSGDRVKNKEYGSFAKSFPSLIQSAGLCQAVAFAQAKGRGEPGKKDKPPLVVLKDVVKTMGLTDITDDTAFATKARTAGVMEYVRLSRIALQAATWVKRYVEALDDSTPQEKGSRNA